MSPTTAARAARSARTSLRRRLLIALIAASVALVVVLAWALVTLDAVRDRQDAVVGAYFEAISEADAAFIRLADAETAVRGYALTGDEVVLESFHRLARDPDGPDVEALLVEQLGAGHELVTRRAAAAEAASRWYSEFAAPLVAQVQAQGPGPVDAATAQVGAALFDEVRAQVDVYLVELTATRTAALRDLRGSMGDLFTAIWLLALAAVISGILLWVYLRRWVTGPLAVLADDARTVAGGDLDHQVTDSGPGEVGDVARDVEQMRARLSHLVAEATSARAALEHSHARLQAQAEDLHRSNRDLEQFAYVASHDLQEPLRKVASFTQLLAKRYEGQLDERADQYIGFAVDGAKRMQHLINDLLSFSRVGRSGGQTGDVDLGDLLDRVRDDFAEVIADADAVVEGVDLPVVRGEAPLLTQLLVNLVGNALKFRHPDRAPVVRLEARRDGSWWEVACTDNGIGIDAQYADRVFVIFQRLHAKDAYDGTGIGLALCKKIVEYHGGEIWIDHQTVVGTTIRFTLPATGPGAPAAEPATRARTQDGAP